MKSNTRSKILSVLLSAVMLVSIIPIPVLAQEYPANTSDTVEAQEEPTTEPESTDPEETQEETQPTVVEEVPAISVEEKTEVTPETPPEEEGSESAETADSEEETVDEIEEESEEIETLGFDQSQTASGVEVRVKAVYGAFPEDAILSVKQVSVEEEQKAEQAIEEVRSEEQNVVASYTFDISILDADGNELQPAEGFDVQVSCALAEAAEEGIEASVYHIHEDDGGMTAETLDIVSESGDTVTVLTDSFSLYNVTLAAVGAAQTVSISYVDAKGNAKGPVDCRPVTEKNLDNGWYAVTEDVSFSENMEVSGNVNLILCDGKTLRPNLGIYVKQDASLTIWAQSTGKNMGKLVADITSSYDYAAIGGKDDKFAGAITINGGNITAKARIYSDHPGSAGIGAGKNGPGYTGITINGGVVEALGSCRAAGIGGTEKTTSPGPIEITGGTVTVTGGAGRIRGGAGIGGGSHCTYSGELIIKITGGDVTVTGGDTGIGLGYYSQGSVSLTIENAVVNVTSTKQCGIQVDTVKITSSQVTVVGYTDGISSTNKVTIDGGKKKESLIRLTGRSGAGINGNGIKLTIDGEGTVNALGAIAGIYVTEVTINGGEVISTCANHENPGIQSKRLTINGGDVTAQGGTYPGTDTGSSKGNGGAGICLAENGTLTINGGMLKAIGGGSNDSGGAGIGGNYSCGGETTRVIINGGTVIAKGGPKAAGIGGGAEGFWGGGGEGCDEVQINGGVVIAQSGGGKSSAIGHGDNDKEYGHIKFKNGMWVHAGWSEEEALKNDPFTAEGRESACQYRHYARIDGECDHPWEPVKDSELKTIRFTEITKTWHLRAPCAYCNQVFAGEAHDCDDAGVCMVCGYQEDGKRITFDANGGTGAMEDRFIAKGRAMALPECLFTGPDGRIFSGWKIGEKTYQEAEPVTIDADVTAVAQWKAPYVITFDPGGGTGEMEPGEAGVGEKYPLPPCKFTEPEWHDFVGWQVGQDQEHLKQPLETFTVEGNTTVTARWERPEYAITFDSYGGSKVSNQHALKGAHAMVPDPAPTMEEREFLGWRLDGEDFDFENTPITRDITLVAHWSNEWVDLQKEIDEAEDGATITLTGNVTARDDDVVLTIPDGKSITIDLAGCTLNRNLDEAEEEGNVITVKGSLTVEDSSSEKTGTITGGNNVNEGGGIVLYKEENGSAIALTLNGGSITGNVSEDRGGGVYMESADGSFTMNGGSIANNTSGSDGGGVAVLDGSFTFNGGSVSGNRAENDGNGGGVYFASGESVFTMKEGTVISNNNAANGGGVYVEYGTFNMNDGSIDNNTAKYNGGGVYMMDADFTMVNSTISDNGAGEDGGGVYIEGKGSVFAMTSSGITGNTADSEGGGVFMYDGSFTMNSGSITGNTAKGDGGGGVYTCTGCDFTLVSGEISNNEGGIYGGGVCAESNFTMKGGEISGNTADYQGGGVYAEGDDYFTMTGGSITGNRIINSDGDDDAAGGGVYVANRTAVFNLSGDADITGNTVGGKSSGIYLETGMFITVKGALTNSKPIGISMQTPGVFTSGLSDNGTAASFASDDDIYMVGVNGDGEAYLETAITVWQDLQDQINGAEDGVETTIILTGDVKALSTETALTVPAGKKITLDLNGHAIDRNLTEAREDGNVFTVNGSLTVKDSGKGGLITGGKLLGNGGGVVVMAGASFTLAGGEISGNEASANAGGVLNNGTFTMTGGTISKNAADYRGGGVYNQSTFNMSGSAAIDGNTSGYEGGGVHVEFGGTFKLSGGVEISANKGKDGVDDNVCLKYDSPTRKTIITVEGKLTNAKPIGVGVQKAPQNTPDYIDVTAGLNGDSTDSVKGFTSELEGYQVFLNTDSGEAILAVPVDIVLDKNGAGATGSMEDLTMPKGIASKLYANQYTWRGHSFAGWNTAANGSGTRYEDEGVVTVSAKTTFYAQWTAHDFTVAAIPAQTYAGKALTPAPVVKDKTTGETLKAGADYTVAYKNNVNAGTATATVTGKGDYAEAKAVSVTFAINKAAPTVTAPTAKTLTYNGSAQELVTAGEATGGTMQYALGDANGPTGEYTTAIPTGTDAGIYYVWYKVVGDDHHTDTQPISIEVTISMVPVFSVLVTDDGNGTASANPASGETGTEVTLTAEAKEGYRFREWQVISGGVTVTDNRFIIGSANAEIRAAFEEIPEEPAAVYTVTVINDGNGTASANPASGETGTEVTLTAEAKEGYRFREWQVISGGVTVTDNRFRIGNANAEIRAVFEEIPVEPVQPVTYATVSAVGVIHTIGSGEDAVITVERSTGDKRELELFTGAAVDGIPVPDGSYSAAKGSLILTLKSAYLDTLREGEHKVTISFRDGSAEAALTIRRTGEPAVTTLPKTGDSANPVLWLGMIAAGLAVAFAAWSVKKRRDR